VRTILHLIDTRGPGGAETVFLNLVDGFSRDPYRSIAMVPEGSWVEGMLADRGIPWVHSRPSGSFDLRYLSALVRTIRRERVDLIQTHLLGATAYAVLASWITRVPVVGVFHGTVDLANPSRFTGVKLGLIRRGCDRIVVVSGSLQEQLNSAAAHLPEDRTRVIYNGVDTERFGLERHDRLRQQLGLTPGDVLVASVGNLRGAKGYDHLIEAAGVLADSYPHVHFAIAGEGSGALHQQLMAQRTELGVEDRVHFLGFRDSAVEVLQGSDVFLLPSTSEGFSISTIEAMSCGLPVVATASGGPQEIITPDQDGVLVPPGSGQAIADALAQLVAHPEYAGDLGAKARDTVLSRFSGTAQIAAYEGVYSEVL